MRQNKFNQTDRVEGTHSLVAENRDFGTGRTFRVSYYAKDSVLKLNIETS